MAINAKKLLDKLPKPKPKRNSITLYIDREVFESFKNICGDVSPSKVVSQMMREFIDSTKEVVKK